MQMLLGVGPTEEEIAAEQEDGLCVHCQAEQVDVAAVLACCWLYSSCRHWQVLKPLSVGLFWGVLLPLVALHNMLTLPL